MPEMTFLEHFSSLGELFIVCNDWNNEDECFEEEIEGAAATMARLVGCAPDFRFRR